MASSHDSLPFIVAQAKGVVPPKLDGKCQQARLSDSSLLCVWRGGAAGPRQSRPGDVSLRLRRYAESLGLSGPYCQVSLSPLGWRAQPSSRGEKLCRAAEPLLYDFNAAMGGTGLSLTKPQAIHIRVIAIVQVDAAVPLMQKSKASAPRTSGRFNPSQNRQEDRLRIVTPSRDVKNAGRSGDMYENKGLHDKMPESKRTRMQKSTSYYGQEYTKSRAVADILDQADGHVGSLAHGLARFCSLYPRQDPRFASRDKRALLIYLPRKSLIA